MGYDVSHPGGRAVIRLITHTVTGLALTGFSLLGTTAAIAQSAKGEAKTQSVQQPPASQRRPLIAVVSTGQQRITVYDKDGVVTQSPISSGRKGFESPEGVFSILEKKEDHFSNVYEDGEMPFMQRLTWSGVALHAGNLPGYPASHGCIRLPHQFAERLYEISRVNTRVVVVPTDTVPMSIAHPSLFDPQRAAPVPVAPLPVGEAPAGGLPTPLFREHGNDTINQPMMLGAVLAKPIPPDASSAALKPQKAVVTPLAAARARRTAALEKVQAATSAADAAKLVHRAKLGEIAKAHRAAGAATVLEKRAWSKAIIAEKQIAKAKTEQQLDAARALHVQSLAEATAAATAATEAKARFASLTQEAREADEAAKRAEQDKAAAHSEARIADRMTDPVSVLVSRATGKLYIRQGRHPMAEMPVTIKDPTERIGTHVFTAMAVGDTGAVTWKVVTAQVPNLPKVETPPQSSTKGKRSKAEPPKKPISPSSAMLGTEALDRIEFSEAAIARIAPYVQAGSSLIISDLAPSIETGPGTDFIIQTRGEEQAIADAEKRAKEVAAFKAGEKWAKELMEERAERAERAKERAQERAEERASERVEKPSRQRKSYN